MRPNWAEINLDAVEQNIRQIREHLDIHGRRDTEISAVVKADAYGHGAEMVASSVLRAGADSLSVAFLEEALALRDWGFEAPILVLGWTPPEMAITAVERGLILTVVSEEHGRALAAELARYGCRARVHLKVETGMGRLGMGWDEPAISRAISIIELDHLQVEGAFTHFSVADEDLSFTREQIRRFRHFVRELRMRGMDLSTVHACNSAGVLDFPEAAFDVVRPGLMLYGVYPTEQSSRSVPISPFLQWKSRIAQVKTVPPGEGVSYGRTYIADEPTRIATVPCGYADGYPRGLSNRGDVLVRGRRCRIAGRVCMDQMMLVIPPDLEDVRAGTEVTLLGRDGEEEITVEELAGAMETIAHEIFTGITKRVPREFRRGGRTVGRSEVLHF